MANKLIKKDLIETIRTDSPLSVQEAETVLDGLLAKLLHAFQNGQKIEVRGFGTFTPKVRLGSKKRNPRTGETVYTSDALTVRFKLAKEHQKL
jgi:integration host factor subunit beta